MSSPVEPSNGHGGGEDEDLLSRILREFDEHCDQLEPMADEYDRVIAARDALVAGLEVAPAPEPESARPRSKPRKRRRLSDGEMLESVYAHVQRYPGITPNQLAQVMGYASGTRSRMVTRPLSRLHRLGRIEREGDGFRVAGDA
jgi:hypothetical protein